jgi:hypothetical protein
MSHTSHEDFPMRFRFGLAAGLTLVAMAGCGGSGDGLPRQEVIGKVTLDGQPIENGMITFDPIDGSPHAASAVIQNGEYRIEREDGPLPGKHRVSVWAQRTTGKTFKDPDDPERVIEERVEVVPVRYNLQSELYSEIQKDGANDFPFELRGGLKVATTGNSRR